MFQSKCKDQVCGYKPRNTLHFTGTKLQLIHNKVSQSATRGRQNTALGLMHAHTNTEEGSLKTAGWAEARSLVESSLQDALEREGDKLEALARVELVLELNPERKREKTVWLNIHTSMYESCPVKAFLN